MSHLAPQHDASIASAHTRAGARELPPQVVEARDELFRNADRHGPRAGDLARRVAPAVAVLPLTMWLSTNETWRSVLIDRLPAGPADAVLLVPVLCALVYLATAFAPLARISVGPLLLLSMVLLGMSTFFVTQGMVVLATTPAALGATLLGIAAARAMRRAVWTLPVLMAAGISDAQSVQGGITRNLLAGVNTGAAPEHVAPTLTVAKQLIANVDFVVLHIPVATGTWVLGLVDVLALGLLLGLSHLFWLRLDRTAIALGAVLVATVGLGAPAPMLPLFGIAWAFMNARLVWRSTRFSLRRLIYIGG